MINLKCSLNFLIAACQRAEEEKAIEQKKILESDFEITENDVFINTITPLDDFLLKKDDINMENDKTDNWKNKLGIEFISKI